MPVPMMTQLTFSAQPGVTILAGTAVAVSQGAGEGWHNGVPFRTTEVSYFVTARTETVAMNGQVTVDILPPPPNPSERILQAIFKAKLG